MRQSYTLRPMLSISMEHDAGRECSSQTPKELSSVYKVLEDCFGPEQYPTFEDSLVFDSTSSYDNFHGKRTSLRIVDGRLQSVGFCIVAPCETHHHAQKGRVKSILRQRKFGEPFEQNQARPTAFWRELVDCIF